jgi:hypothetical protein
MASTTSRTAGIAERLQASLDRAKHWADLGESGKRDLASCYARAVGILDDATTEAIRDLNRLPPAMDACPYCNRAISADSVSCDSCGWVRES